MIKFLLYIQILFFFCEIKHGFQDLSSGKEKVIPVQMKTQEESKHDLTPYQVQLEKLFRKFIFFFDIYKKTINQKNIQIVFIYDNVEAIRIYTFDKIKEDTEKILKKLSGKFQNFNKIIFQLIYFNYSNYTKVQMIENKIKDKTIKNQENELNNKDQIIEEKNKIIKEKENELKEIAKIMEDQTLDPVKKMALVQKLFQK